MMQRHHIWTLCLFCVWAAAMVALGWLAVR